MFEGDTVVRVCMMAISECIPIAKLAQDFLNEFFAMSDQNWLDTIVSLVFDEGVIAEKRLPCVFSLYKLPTNRHMIKVVIECSGSYSPSEVL